MPFDVEALLRDQATEAGAGDNERYMAGFHAVPFFNAGPSGYDAVFTIRAGDVRELADIKFSNPIEVQISGSLLLYDLDAPMTPEAFPAPGFEDAFPGVRRMILERQLRYTFVRFGVPYLVSITCFDGGTARYKMPTCKSADQVGQRFLRALHVVGGMPRMLRPAEQPSPERATEASHTFGYYAPGQLVSGTGFRERSGRVDYTAYSQIRFPLADTPVTATTEVFQRRRETGAAGEEGLGINQPWRDNFCERRGFPVAQCPSGIGHQGQDLRPAPCKPAPGSEKCTSHGGIVAVRDGVIQRSPGQEAAYLFVNTGSEHIRFRYLHMSPRKMDADGLLNGRRVYEGEVIGEVSNFSMKEAGTSFHVHFDVQVPTKYGWVFVNPYMTLVASYERLIGERGTELSDPAAVTTADASGATTALAPSRIEPDRPRHAAAGRGHARAKSHRRQHMAGR